MLKDLNVVLGVTGGIAAYKACDIITNLRKEGANVEVIMTSNATKFITPLTLMTLSNNKVITDMFEIPQNYEVEHISLAKKADVILIAPATANIIGKIANGIADDMLSTTIMASKALVVFAPAMNDQMYANEIVQDNIKKLERFGYKFILPIEGRLACNTKGVGKLEKPQKIVEKLKELIKEKCI